MRRLLIPLVLLAFVITAAACSRSSELDNLKPGASLTLTMKDGSVVSGRLVEAKADQVVIDPFEGGEWRTLQRAQIASVKQTDAANTTAALPPQPEQPSAAAPQPAPADTGSTAATTSTRPRSPRPAERSSAVPSTEPGGTPATETRPRGSFNEVTVPANTVLRLRLDNRVASDTSHVEDPVRASVTTAVVVDGVDAIPAGSDLKGVVTEATPAGKVKGRASVGFRFDTLSAHGEQYKVRTQGIAQEAESTRKKDAAKIGIPAAGGAIIGGILGGKKGAVIGGAVGGGAGTAVVLTTPGEELRLPAGTAIRVKLLEPLTVRVPVSR